MPTPGLPEEQVAKAEEHVSLAIAPVSAHGRG